MEEELPQQSNKYIEYFKSHKYNIYALGAILILVILSTILLIATISSGSRKKTITPVQVQPTEGVSAAPSSIPSIVSPSVQVNSQEITPNPTQATVIENQLQPQINTSTPVNYTITSITQFGNNWAKVSINNSSVGGGGVIAKNENGTWKVVYGPASLFPTQILQSIGAPQSLIESFSSSESTSPSPSLSP